MMMNANDRFPNHRGFGRLLFLLTLAVFCAQFDMAQAQLPATSPVELPDGVVMQDTIAALRLDLTALKPRALFAMVSGGQNMPELAMAETAVQATLSKLIDAGTKEVYATIPTSAIPSGAVCLVIPCQDTETVATILRGLVAMLPKPLAFVVLEQSARVVVCPELIVPKFDPSAAASQKVQRDDLAGGLQSVSAFPHQAVFSLPEDLQAMLGRVFPDHLSPKLATEFSPSRFVESVDTLAIGWSMPPRVDIEARMFTADAASTAAAREQMTKLLKLAPQFGDAVTMKSADDELVLGIDPKALSGLLAEIFDVQRQAARRLQASNNLKQIGLAMHNYHSTYGQMVPAAIRSEDGKPLLSWRVALLPFLEQQELYQRFKLDEPWDSAHNKPLLAQMPPLFADAFGQALPAGMTNYRLPVIPGSIWSTAEPLKFAQITDGTSNTIWLIRAPQAAAVEWTKPEPWELETKNLRASIFGDATEAIVGFVDGSVRPIQAANSEQTLQHALQYADANALEID